MPDMDESESFDDPQAASVVARTTAVPAADRARRREKRREVNDITQCFRGVRAVRARG
ncbi:hypothetical protein GCM10009680_57880 [Streptomyces yatensis]|uniref:Uncharacterized protein n=1 Tax=Streptomyces yatensis TaxID=155177 RepID=A0ABN2IPT2_9ACTN